MTISLYISIIIPGFPLFVVFSILFSCSVCVYVNIKLELTTLMSSTNLHDIVSNKALV